MNFFIENLYIIIMGGCIGVLIARANIISRRADALWEKLYQIRNELTKELVSDYEHEFLKSRVRDLEEDVRFLQNSVKKHADKIELL